MFGVRSDCKDCHREKYRYLQERYREKYAKELNQYGKKWREENKDKIKNYRREKRHLYNSHQQRRELLKVKATPNWLTKEDFEIITNIYLEAKYFGYHVDHIVPIRGKKVCGLHVPDNLQILSPFENISKKNRYEVV